MDGNDSGVGKLLRIEIQMPDGVSPGNEKNNIIQVLTEIANLVVQRYPEPIRHAAQTRDAEFYPFSLKILDGNDWTLGKDPYPFGNQRSCTTTPDTEIDQGIPDNVSICARCAHVDNQGFGGDGQSWLCKIPKLDHITGVELTVFCKDKNKSGMCRDYQC